MSRRDVDRELRFLTDAARGHRPFVEHATARLAAGDETFGDSWAWIGVARHLTELLEEAADLGAWAALCDQAADLERLSTDDKRRLEALLRVVARRGAQAHEALTSAVRALAVASPTADGKERP